MDLAAEIKKLSDRLMMLSSINTELRNYNDKVVIDSTTTTVPPTTKPKPTKSTDSNETNLKKTSTNKSETKLKSTTDATKVTKKKLKTNNTTIGNSIININSDSLPSIRKSTFKRSSSVITNGSSSSKTDNSLSERLKLLDETPNLSQKFDLTRNGGNITTTKTTSSSIKSSTTQTTSSKLNNSETTSNNVMSSTNGSAASSAPWPITTKRTKFRITQMSRDVPMYSPNTHQTVFLDEESVNTTKDCLLQLLEKYNQTDNNRSYTSLGMMGRHQSISDGFGISDNLEYRSMNSLNYFFQRHANAGTTVKSIQAQIESKNK